MSQQNLAHAVKFIILIAEFWLFVQVIKHPVILINFLWKKKDGILLVLSLDQWDDGYVCMSVCSEDG